MYGNRASSTVGAAPRRPARRCSPRRAIASKRWAFEQYDSIVGSRTVRRPESRRRRGARGSPRPAARSPCRSTATGAASPAIPTGARSRPCSSAPRTSPASGRSRWASPTASTSGTPRSRTSPGSSTARSQGLADACRALGVPVVGGNVSLYNETERGPIYPTPVVGIVGELPDPGRPAGIAPADGDAIALVGPFAPSLAGLRAGEAARRAGPGLPESRRRRGAATRSRSSASGAGGRPRAAHDVSDGGLACALAEWRSPATSAVSADLDALVELRGCSGETALFGEGAGRVRRRRAGARDRAARGLGGVSGGGRAGDRARQGTTRSSSPPPRPSLPPRSRTPSTPGARSASAWRTPQLA